MQPSLIVKWWVLLWCLLVWTTGLKEGIWKALLVVASNVITIGLIPLCLEMTREHSVVREWVFDIIAYTVNAVRYRLETKSSLSQLRQYANIVQQMYLRLKSMETDRYYFGGHLGGDEDLSDLRHAFIDAVNNLMIAVKLQGLL